MPIQMFLWQLKLLAAAGGALRSCFLVLLNLISVFYCATEGVLCLPAGEHLPVQRWLAAGVPG